MNQTTLIITAIVVLALIVFLVLKNKKDKKMLVDQLNNDYHKTKDTEGDIETDEKI